MPWRRGRGAGQAQVELGSPKFGPTWELLNRGRRSGSFLQIVHLSASPPAPALSSRFFAASLRTVQTGAQTHTPQPPAKGCSAFGMHFEHTQSERELCTWGAALPEDIDHCFQTSKMWRAEKPIKRTALPTFSQRMRRQTLPDTFPPRPFSSRPSTRQTKPRSLYRSSRRPEEILRATPFPLLSLPSLRLTHKHTHRSSHFGIVWETRAWLPPPKTCFREPGGFHLIDSRRAAFGRESPARRGRLREGGERKAGSFCSA